MNIERDILQALEDGRISKRQAVLLLKRVEDVPVRHWADHLDCDDATQEFRMLCDKLNLFAFTSIEWVDEKKDC